MYPPSAELQSKAVFQANSIRCLLVHGQAVLRQGLHRLLAGEHDLDIVGEAENAAECLQKVFELRPDIVIADARTFGGPASEVESLLRRQSDHTKLLLFDVQPGLNSKAEYSRTGASSARPERSSLDDLVHMIRRVYSTAMKDEEALPAVDHGSDRLAPALPQSVLTAREREVLRLLAEGKTVRAAAAVLGLSSKTVDAHKFNLMRKLRVHNKAQLVMWAIRTKMVEIPPSL